MTTTEPMGPVRKGLEDEETYKEPVSWFSVSTS